MEKEKKYYPFWYMTLYERMRLLSSKDVITFGEVRMLCKTYKITETMTRIILKDMQNYGMIDLKQVGDPRGYIIILLNLDRHIKLESTSSWYHYVGCW